MDEQSPEGTKVNSTKDSSAEDVVRIAIEVGIGLRRSLSNNGIRQMADFVNGMAFAGILLQKNLKPVDDGIGFIDIFEETFADYVTVIMEDRFAKKRADMIQHDIGIADQPPTEMLVTAGFSVQETVTTIVEEFDLSKRDTLRLVTIIIALAVGSLVSRRDLEKVVQDLIEGVREKARVWDARIPSDEEMFGDWDDEEGSSY